jgi:hypothetical protein
VKNGATSAENGNRFQISTRTKLDTMDFVLIVKNVQQPIGKIVESEMPKLRLLSKRATS